jgi:hypothetical protein
MRTPFIFFFLLFYVTHGFANIPSRTCSRWEVIDLAFKTNSNPDNPLNTELTAEFRHSTGKVIKVPGFYDGSNTWIIRFCPLFEGSWTYQTSSTWEPLNNKKGELHVLSDSLVGCHGAVKVCHENPQRFIFEDNTSFFPLAFELDWLFALDATNPDDIPRTRKLVSTIKQYGFNKVIMNVFAFDANWGERDKINPEYDFSSPLVFPFGGTNLQPDYSTINYDFFRHFDRIMKYLNENGMVSHLMIYVWNKKVNWPDPGSEEDNLFFDYIVKRYQAFPNLIWDISKEALAHGMDDMNYIFERIDRLRRLDGHKRLVTVHDYKFCKAYPDKVDFISIQEWKPNLYDQMITVTNEHINLPVFNVEHGGYEKTMHSIFDGAYNDPIACLERSYICLFAGTYTTYYWQNTSWYEVVYDPFSLPLENQPHFHYYNHLRNLFSRFDYNLFTSQQYFYSSYCLTDNKNTYLFLAPTGMAAIEGTPPSNIKNTMVRITWFNPLDGSFSKTEERMLNYWMGFKKPEDLSSPFAVAIVTRI